MDNPKLDYDMFSTYHILQNNPNMSLEMAECIKTCSHRQIIRNTIKKELLDYFYTMYINDECKFKRCRDED